MNRILPSFSVLMMLLWSATALPQEASSEERALEGAAGHGGVSSTASLDKATVLVPIDPLCSNATHVLYRFSGATDDGQQGSGTRKEATSIHCTNVGSGSTQVEVQIYQWNGTDVFYGCIDMPPNRTFTYSTQNTSIYFDDVILGGPPGTDAIFQGSGAVLASNSDVVCSAEALDPLNYPPVFATGLTLWEKSAGPQILSNAFYYTGSGFETFFLMQNTTGSSLEVSVRLKPSGSGAMSSSISIPAGESQVVLASSIVGQNSFGAATIRWTGTSGDVVATATTVNFAEGVTIDSDFSHP